jgi:hypothetical protein
MGGIELYSDASEVHAVATSSRIIDVFQDRQQRGAVRVDADTRASELPDSLDQ